MVLTFLVLRTALLMRPNADLNVGPYNIHHLYTGLLVVAGCAIPLAVGGLGSRAAEVLLLGLGIGLGLALDEWVYLIATDGSNAAYLTPPSFWGGLVLTGVAALYALLSAGWWVRARPRHTAKD
jgi:hypothetical protein